MTWGQPCVSEHGKIVTMFVAAIGDDLTFVHWTIAWIVATLDARASPCRFHQLNVMVIP